MHVAATEQVQGPAAGPVPAAATPAAAQAPADRLAAALANADPAARARLAASIQRSHGNAAVGRLAAIARTPSFDECSAERASRIELAHDEGKAMLATAYAKLGEYDGTNPADVKAALDKHFHSSTTTTAGFVRYYTWAMKSAMAVRGDPQYECQAEADGNTLAWVPWCVPFADIEVYPLWFTKKDGTQRELKSQAETLIHEWFHKYGCKLDLGYEGKKAYEENSTLAQIFNSDSFSEFIEAVS